MSYGLWFRTYLKHPLQLGALFPSGSALSRLMVKHIDPNTSGYVLEFGPGTGSFTKALIQRGIPALMEEITQDKIQIMGGLNKTFKRKLEAQENDDQIFWVDQPLDSNKYSWDKGFLKILDVLTEEEFKAKYYVPESGR